MKRIIVTGATSMIGTALIETAIRENINVYAVIRPDSERQKRLPVSPLIHIVYGRLESLNETEGLPDNCDVLYHLAWAGTSKDQRDDPKIQEANIRYTLEAVLLAKRCGCRRFVGAGSQAEYGPVYDEITDETKFRPVISYGIAKYAANVLSNKLCEKLDIEFVWGRIFSVYGPHDNKGTMLDYAIDCFIKGETAKFSPSKQIWNYLYESDAGEMLFHIGTDKIKPGVWLIASNESRPLYEYIKILLNEYGADAKAEFAKSNEKSYPGLNISSDRVVPIEPKITFEEGIKRMIKAKIGI